MTDLQSQLEAYLRETSIPVDIDALATGPRLEPGTALAPRPARRRWRPAAAFALAALGALLIGLPFLFGDSSPSPVAQDSATTVPGVVPPTDGAVADGVIAGVHGAWVHSVVETGFEAHDLRSTSFGLVAAAGPDGVWTSLNGTEWQQVLATPYEASEKTWEGEPPRVASEVEAIAEYDGALYAFGTSWNDPDGSEGSEGDSRLVAWRSADGRSWEEILVSDDSWSHGKPIEAVAGEGELLLYARLPGYSRFTYRSDNGDDWTRIDADEASPPSVQLWAISRFGDGYVALGEKTSEQAAVFASPDGITWEETGPWTITREECLPQPMNFSVWALVDLIETPYGLIAVGTPEPFNARQGAEERQPRVVLAVSIDGRTFEALDQQHDLFLLEDQREEIWPPFRPPEGTMFDDQIVLIGHSYPDNSGEPVYHQWVWTPSQP